MVIPTQQLLEKNNSSKYSPEISLYHYENVVAHEIGHAMGLNDAYTVNGIVRSLVTDEIGHVVTKDKEAYHVMNNGNRDYSQVYPNDVEMIIQAQKDALANKNSSFQSYKTYTDKGNVKYKKSKVIKKVR